MVALNSGQKFLCVLSYSQLSTLEIVSVQDSHNFDFEILESSEDSLLMLCSRDTARVLARRLGGVFKFVRTSGSSLEDMTKTLPLPESPKFNWTISSYGCDLEEYEDTRL